MAEVKCVVVGDGAAGKTCMLIAYTDGKFPKEYIPTVFDNFEATVLAEGKEVKFSLWDTAGQDGYKRIRTLSYPKTDIFLVCFAVTNRASFQNVKDRWYPEITHSCPSVPFIIVGTKSDLRQDEATLEQLYSQGQRPVSDQEIKTLVKEIHAEKYLECSALTREGLTQVFAQALICGSEGPKKSLHGKKTKGCALL